MSDREKNYKYLISLMLDDRQSKFSKIELEHQSYLNKTGRVSANKLIFKSVIISIFITIVFTMADNNSANHRGFWFFLFLAVFFISYLIQLNTHNMTPKTDEEFRYIENEKQRKINTINNTWVNNINRLALDIAYNKPNREITEWQYVNHEHQLITGVLDANTMLFTPKKR